jgi:hypothetical protein
MLSALVVMLRPRLEREVTALNAITETYSKALREHFRLHNVAVRTVCPRLRSMRQFRAASLARSTPPVSNTASLSSWRSTSFAANSSAFFLQVIGGVDGTRTRGLRRDRRKS